MQLRFLDRSLISHHVPDLAYIFGRGFYLFIVGCFFFAGEVGVPWIFFSLCGRLGLVVETGDVACTRAVAREAVC